MKNYIAWFFNEGIDEYMIITADSMEEAELKFHRASDCRMVDIHEIDEVHQLEVS